MTDRELIEGIEDEFDFTPNEAQIKHVINWLFDCTCEPVETLDFIDMMDRIDDALTAYDVELTG